MIFILFWNCLDMSLFQRGEKQKQLASETDIKPHFGNNMSNPAFNEYSFDQAKCNDDQRMNLLFFGGLHQ